MHDMLLYKYKYSNNITKIFLLNTILRWSEHNIFHNPVHDNTQTFLKN